MAKNKISVSVSYDAPVTLTFSLVSVVIFFIGQIVLKAKGVTFSIGAPTAAGGQSPFVYNDFMCYVKIFAHVFTAENLSLLISNLIVILLLGPVLEEYYGSVIVGIMMGVCALLSGVLNACFCKHSACGCEPIVFMLILLNAFISINKKKIPLASVFVLILFIAGQVSNPASDGFIIMIINVAGGLCGSLLAFLTSPKARAAKKNGGNSKSQNKSKEEIAEEIDSQSPRFKKNNRRNDDDDETTVIGTLKF